MTTRLDSRITIWFSAVTLLICPGIRAEAGQDDFGPLPSEPRVQALVIDGEMITGRIRSLSPDGRATFVDETGDERTIAPGSLVKLSKPGRPQAGVSSDGAVLVFPDGDCLRGLIDSADERSISVRSPLLGALDVPLEFVLGFSTGPMSDPRTEAETLAILRDETRTSDLLLLENGDRRQIAFTRITGDLVEYLDSDRGLTLPKGTVRAIGLDPGLVRRPPVESPSLDLILTDGSRVRLLGPESSAGRLKGRTTFGAEVDLSLEHVAEAYLLSDSIAYLSDLEAAREVTVPYVGPGRSAVSNGSVLGGPLVVGGRRFLRGIGTQSRSLLAYRLGPEDRRFQSSVAMDDSAGPLGNVVCRVLVDGEERFVSQPMAVGDEPIPVDVDLAGGQFLILATEFGLGGGIRDYANWIEPRLIRGADPRDETPEVPDAGN